MRTNERSRQTWSAAVSAVALLALTTGTALAAAPGTNAYDASSHPMISGTVVTLNDRQMVVDTDQGERVALELDSQTMAPRDLAPGMLMRADFLALDDCRFYAQRITPIRNGMSANRLQAYANTRDSRESIAHNASGFRGYRREYGETQASAAYEGSSPQTMSDHSPGQIMTATPTTRDYHFSTYPMVSGRVLSVNDHRVVLKTDQGQAVGLVMDSRTMVPSAVAPGSDLRAEFTQLKDGRFYANRISLIGNRVVDREQAYAHTRDSDLLLAANTMDCGFGNAPSRNSVSAAVVTPAPIVAQRVPAERPETLPQTASEQPLVLLLGLLALGSAGALTVVRRLRTA